jgi:hypothetical protein
MYPCAGDSCARLGDMGPGSRSLRSLGRDDNLAPLTAAPPKERLPALEGATVGELSARLGP